jgi:hypothetical protein
LLFCGTLQPAKPRVSHGHDTVTQLKPNYHVVVDAKVVDHCEKRGYGEHTVEHLAFEIRSHQLFTNGLWKRCHWFVTLEFLCQQFLFTLVIVTLVTLV